MATPELPNRNLSLVTGANGHLGNNIVRELCARGLPVRAGVRRPQMRAPFEGLECSIVKLDMEDERSMVEAMDSVDVVYASAASVKLWARDMKKEVYDVNVNAARVLVQAAKAAGVRRVVFVSSMVALDCTTVPTSEANGYNPDRDNAYYSSKTDSEQLALDLGRTLGIDVVSVLPGTLIGAHCFNLNESYRILATIHAGKLPFDPNIYLNWCDVKDVARGCIAAGSRGVPGERYILAQEQGTSIRDTIIHLNELFPKRKASKVPPRPPRFLIWTLAWIMETVAAITGSAPLLQTSFVNMLWGLRLDFDTSKAQRQLELRMKPVRETLKDAIAYLEANPHLTADLA